MLEKYIPKRFATAMIKHVIAVTLFFPYIYSHNENPAYADFMLVNVFVILAMVFICTSWKLDFKRNGIFVGGLGILLLAYNGFATYMNMKYHHWYGDQFNTTLAFLFFMLLLLVKDSHALIDTATIKATIHMIVASNVLAIGYYTILDKSKLIFMNDWIEMIVKPWYDLYYSWIYGHKSEYGFLLVLGIAFFACHKMHFSNTLTYILSQIVLFYALYLSDVYTSIVAAILIFFGQFLDNLLTAKWWKKILAALSIPPVLLLMTKKVLTLISSGRELLTLGYRIPIWKQFLVYICQNPNGIMEEYSKINYPVSGIDFQTNNCHNVFLNHMFRFSIPVGVLFTTCFFLIIFFSMKRNVSFTTLFVWCALLIPLNMDQALTAIAIPYFLLVLYILFFTSNTIRLPNSNSFK